MPKLLTGIFAATGLVLAAVAPAQAANPPQHVVSGSAQLICDGDGLGSCKSLPIGGVVMDLGPIFAVNGNGAWRWDVSRVGTVTSSTFSYTPIDNQLAGQPILKIALHFDNFFCNGNSGGSDLLKVCDGSASELWVADPGNAYLVNVGRSNDQDNWEVLCNPGGGGQLVIGTRDSCTTYHEQWASA